MGGMKRKAPAVVADIAAEMERQGLTEYALAKRARMPAATLNRILNGSRPDPRFSSLDRLAKALGMRVKLSRFQT